MVLHLYLPNRQKCDSIRDFIDYYSKEYFERTKDTVAESLADNLLRADELTAEDVFFILAWKIGGIDMTKTNAEKKISYFENKGWVWDEVNPKAKNSGNDIKPLKTLLVKVAEISRAQKPGWKEEAFAEKADKATGMLKSLVDLDTEHIGCVYMLTLLYFLTNGRWPIYDRFAYLSMIGISEDKKPGINRIPYPEQRIPYRQNKSFKSEMSGILYGKDDYHMYGDYVEFLKKFEEALLNEKENRLNTAFDETEREIIKKQYGTYVDNRDIDRALWSYGHYFVEKKNKRKYPDDYTPNLYEGDDSVRYLLGNKGKNPLICLSINPSRACLEYSDPTMNTLINILNNESLKDQGYRFDSCIMINPAPFRSPSPIKLPKEPEETVLEHNREVIHELFEKHRNSTMLCGWGDYALYGYQWFKESLKDILDMAKEYSIKLVAIRINKSGQPAHLSFLNRKNKTFGFNHGKGTYKLTEYQPII